MPWTGAQGPTEAQKCIGCHTRYWQSAKTHLCRQCEKEVGIVDSINTRRRAELLELEEAQEKMLERMVPKEPRELAVNGQLFTVVWDGSK